MMTYVHTYEWHFATPTGLAPTKEQIAKALAGISQSYHLISATGGWLNNQEPSFCLRVFLPLTDVHQTHSHEVAERLRVMFAQDAVYAVVYRAAGVLVTGPA